MKEVLWGEVRTVICTLFSFSSPEPKVKFKKSNELQNSDTNTCTLGNNFIKSFLKRYTIL